MRSVMQYWEPERPLEPKDYEARDAWEEQK